MDFYKILFYFTLLGLCIRCDIAVDKKPIQEEIYALKTVDDKRVYLENIFEDDQEMRRDGQSTLISLKYGSQSKEHLEFVETMNTLDRLNLQKIEAYLEKYGHPIKKELGEIASLTPWVVIHHSSTYEERERNFKYLYNSYKNEDIEESHFSMFLDRMYMFKYDKRLDTGDSYKEEDRINELIKELNLKTK